MRQPVGPRLDPARLASRRDIGSDLAGELRRSPDRSRTRYAQRRRSAVEIILDSGALREHRRADAPRRGELGAVGPAARASGVDLDTRRDFPAAVYRDRRPAAALGETGDVFARAQQRWREIENSLAFLMQVLEDPGAGPVGGAVGALMPNALVLSLIEGWRGEIVHLAVTDAAGRFAHYKIVDPSFRNWFALAFAMRGQPIMDFPLCNKSFNLSYCGHDL